MFNRVLILGMLLWGSDLSAQQIFMSLEQYTDYAIQHNPSIQQALLNEKVEQQNHNAAISPLLPVANAKATINDNLILNTNLLPAEIFGGPAGTFKEVRFGTKYSINPSGDISLNLINAANYKNLSITRQNQSIAGANTQLTIQQVKNSLAQTYYSYLLYQNNYDFAAQNLANADSLLHITQVRYDNQFIDELDLNRSRSARLQAQNQLDQSQVLQEKALNNLKLLAGLSVTDKISIQDKLTVQDIPLADVINTNPFSRPEIQVSYLKNNVSKMTVAREKLKFIPELSVYGNYGVTGQNNTFKFADASQKWYQNGAIGMSLNVPVFAGGIKYFNVQKARLNQQIADIELKNTQLKTAKEDQDLLLDYTKAKKDLSVRREQLKIAEKNYKLALTKYRNEAINYDNLVNIQNEQTNAQQQLLQAEADYVTVQYKIKLINSYDKK